MLKLRIAGLLAVLLHATSAAAEISTQEGGDLLLHGYGTLGAVYHDAPGIQYRRDISQAAAGAKAGQLSFAQDSMLAVQADYRRTSEFSGTVQVVSRLDAGNSFAPQLSLANLKYQMGASDIRLGRVFIETYLEGDAAEIGYAHAMVRQPIIYYPRLMDGLDAETTLPLGGGLLRLQGQAGWAVGKLLSNGQIYDTGGSEALGVGMNYSQAGWTGRISMGQFIYKNQARDLEPGGVFSSLLPSLPNGAAIYDRFTMQGRKIGNRIFTLDYDKDGVQGRAGYALYLSPHWPVLRNFYLRGAYRVGDFTPYASYLKRWSERSFVGTGIPDGLSAQTDVLNLAISNAEASLFCNQAEFALGVRYDFMPQRALKLQWDRIRFQDSLSLIDSRTSSSRAETRGFMSMSLYSVALEFVF